MTLVVRSANVPSSVKSYDEYREHLRHDFWFSCGYCTMTEVEAQGISFEIDHYLAQSRGGSNAYDNLIYSCEPCNSSKTDHPTHAAVAKGYQFFRPDQHDADAHFSLNGVELKAESELIGNYTITVLRLNSRTKRKLRELRQKLGHSRAAMLEGVRALSKVKIDELPSGVRERYQEVKDSLQKLSREAGEERQEILRDIARSPLIVQHDSAEDSARRRYLANIQRALVPPPPK